MWHLDSLTFTQENFVVEVKPISWSNFFQKQISKSNPDPKKLQVSCRTSNPDPVHAHLCYLVEVFGLWFSWVWVQSCFANFESKSNRIRYQLPFKQYDSCLSPGKNMSTKQTETFFSVNTKSKSNPDPATGKKTSLLILLEAAGVRSKKSKIQSMRTSTI